jgi:gliding motility-associated-like protein
MPKSTILLSLAFILFLISPFTSSFGQQCLTNVDFNNWSQAGDPSQGNWNVISGGSEVEQSINGQDTYFVSQTDLINVRITGTFRSTNGDDDWMGFVFGFNDPINNTNDYDTWLFDWKQADQNCAPQGMALTYINGNIPNANQGNYFGCHQTAPFFDIKWDNHNNNPYGWNQNQTYQFELIYTSTNIEVYIDGNLITTYQAQQGECFKPGRFGFYNRSQPDCYYSNFSYELYVDYQFSKNEVCVGEPARMVFLDTCALTNSVVSQYNQITWDYGDGTTNTINNPTVTNVNPTHAYSSPGTYTVELSVTDVNGCSDQITRDITVNPKPNANFTAGDTCYGKATQFTDMTSSTTPISNWSWDFDDGAGSNAQSSSHVYPDSATYTAELIATDNNGCQDTAQKNVEVFPQPTSTDSVVDVACYGNSTGQVFLDVAKGVTPLTYNWSNNTNSQDLTGVPAGNYDVTVTDVNGCSVTNSATVNEPAELIATWTTSQFNGGYEISCAGASDGSINLTVNGGTPPYSYNWNNGQFSSQDLQNVTAGNYTVTITDDNGCTLIKDTVLTEPPALNTSATTSSYAGGYQISCQGNTDGNINLSVSGGVTPYSYNWNNGQFSSEDIQNVGAGSYTVVVTDANNCTTTFDTTLTEPPALTSSWTTSSYAGGYQVSCQGATDGSINLTVNGGTTPYSYNWNNGAYSTQDLTNVGAGSYSVTITDANGCSLTRDTVLTEPPAMSKTISSPTYNNSHNVSCHGGSDGEVNLSVSGGTTPYNYSWSNGDNSQHLTNVGAGQYSVTVTDTNGCTVDTSITLTEPPPIEVEANLTTYNGGWHVSCNGENDGAIDVTVSGGDAPYSYSWNGGTYTSKDVDSVSAGMYTLTVTDNEGCTAVLDTQLTEPPEMVVSSTASDYAGGHNISCHDAEDGSIDISATGGTPQYNYIWDSQPANSSSLQNAGAGNYSVTVTDQNGCRVNTAITLTEPQPLETTVAKEDVTCFDGEDGSVSLTTSGGASPYDYNWSNGLAKANPTSLEKGNYSITITDKNGCTEQTSVTIDQPDPLSIALPDTHKIVLGGEKQLATEYTTNGRPVSFDWRPGKSLTCPEEGSCDQPYVSPLNDLTYTVAMVDENGCRVSASTEVVIKKDKALFIPNAFTPDGNGNNDVFRVNAKGVKEFKLQIFNRWGEEIYRSTDIEQGWDGTLRNGNKAEASTYVYIIYLQYLDNAKVQRQGSISLIR